MLINAAQSLLEQIGELVDEVTRLMDADLESTTEKELTTEQLDGNGASVNQVRIYLFGCQQVYL